MKYLALLRGINVGGNNIISMPNLKICFESMGFDDVSTYIQSGNVLFSSPLKDKLKLEKQIEEKLTETFGYNAMVVIISSKQLESIVNDAPAGFGTRPEDFRYDVLFLKEPLKSEEAILSLKFKEGVDYAATGEGVLYFRRLQARASQSYLSRITLLPIYKQMTIRNWNTTYKLYTLLNPAAKPEQRD